MANKIENKNDNSLPSRNSKSRSYPIILTLLILSFLGFIDSAYLTVLHYQRITPPCSILTGCEFVTNSQFSVVLGIPIALLGSIYFFLLFYLTIALLTSYSARKARFFNLIAYVGLLISLFLFLLQALIIKAFCQYCLLSELIALFIYVFSLQLVRKHT